MHIPMIPIVLYIFLSSLLFSAEHSEGTIVSDRKHAIYWQDSPTPRKSTKDWDDAAAYCNSLELKGRQNWRLPSFNELLSIVDFTRYNPAVNPVFRYTSEGTYWTATDFSATRSRAWTIDFRTGKSYYSYKTTNHAVRCVSDFTEKSEINAKKDEK